MASMLELPREIYLMVCSYLEPNDLARLARVSRDHYLSAQQPLFQNVKISSYDTLVKLLATMLKVPVVSHISAKQRRYWHKLSDAQLRERDMRRLKILLDSRRKPNRIIGAVLERCVNGIVSKCPDVKIDMTLYGLWPDGLKQLEGASLHNVRKLSFFYNGSNAAFIPDREALNDRVRRIWELVLSGCTFPDLQDIYLTTVFDSADEIPTTISENLLHMGDRFRYPPVQAYGTQSGGNYNCLMQMERIRLAYNSNLTPSMLRALFASAVIPKRLTTLEIVSCPQIRQTSDLETLATLCTRSFQLLQSLKLHLVTDYASAFKYDAEIDEHPEHHLCNIVRELGQRIKSLDLAMPFACNRMFVAPLEKKTTFSERLEYPDIPQEPFKTLPQRLVGAGYRYRRLIVYTGICGGAHGWDEMAASVVDQGGKVSWDLLYQPEERAVWCVSGCAPVELTWEVAVLQPI